MSHPASATFPPVADLSTEDLRQIVRSGPENRLQWTPRQKDAWRELIRRK